MTLTVSELAALIQRANDQWRRDGYGANGQEYVDWLAEWLLPRLRGENVLPGICAHRFDSTVCVDLAGHKGPHITSTPEFVHGLVIGGALPREPSEAAVEAGLRACPVVPRGAGRVPMSILHAGEIDVILRAAYAIDGVPAVDVGEKP